LIDKDVYNSSFFKQNTLTITGGTITGGLS